MHTFKMCTCSGPVKLTAGRGTLKRKRQLRELIVEHERANHDDIFQSPELKRFKPIKVFIINYLSRQKQEGKTAGLFL